MPWRREWWVPAPQRCRPVFRRCSRFENGTCRLLSPYLRCSAGVRSALVSPRGASVGDTLNLPIGSSCGAFVAQHARKRCQITASCWATKGTGQSQPVDPGTQSRNCAVREIPLNMALRALFTDLKTARYTPSSKYDVRHSTRARLGEILNPAPSCPKLRPIVAQVFAQIRHR
jgi:hypothetical protein